MRTTITLAPDVAAAVEELRRARGAGISDVVNDLVRRGLTARSEPPVFRQTSSSMGVPGYSIDCVSGLLDLLEGEDRRS